MVIFSAAQFLYGIYVLLTVIEFILLVAGHMSIFEAITPSFGTAGTGGFGKRKKKGGTPIVVPPVVWYQVMLNSMAAPVLTSLPLK